MRTLARSALLALLVLAPACGSGPHKRIITRPATYEQLLGFPATGDRLDIPALEREYPELKGIVVTAPEYLVEWEKLRDARMAEGKEIQDFRIPHGASILIEVVNEDKLSRDYFIAPNGFIDFPMIGEVRAAGLTIPELRTQLEKKLREFLIRPQVLVVFKSTPTLQSTSGSTIYSSSTAGQIYVFGASSGRVAGGVPFTGDQTLVSVISLAGLPSSADWRQIRVIRRSTDEPLRKSRVIICDLWDFFAHADVRQDIPLMPGDVVFVPPKLSFAEHLNSDWGLVKRYIDDVFFLDNLKEATSKDGTLRD